MYTMWDARVRKGRQSMRGGERTAAILEPHDGEPCGGDQHHRVGQPVAVFPFGAVGLGRDVPELVVEERNRARFEKFVEGIDDELRREEQQEDRRDLKEARQVDAAS